MSLGQLRRRCRTLLRELDVGQPLDIEELVEKLSASRARRIALAPRPQAPGMFGCVVPMPDVDVIVFHATNPVERTHILAHELAHLFLGHLDSIQSGGIALVCGFDVETVARPHSEPTTSMYDQHSEWAAESAAIILSGWSAAAAGRHASPLPEPAAPLLLSRLDRAFGDLREW